MHSPAEVSPPPLCPPVRLVFIQHDRVFHIPAVRYSRIWSPALQLQNLRSCQGFGQSSFQLSRWAFPFLPVCNFDKRMYARILTCVGIMTHVRRTFLPIPSMGDPEHTHPDSESRCSIISIVTFSGGSSSTCRDRSCRIWGSAAVPLIAALTDNHASLSSSIGLS